MANARTAPQGHFLGAASPAPRGAAALRAAEIARIKIGCGPKGLALDDDTYRALLERLTGKRSAALLNWQERKRVIDHLNGVSPGTRRPSSNEWAFIDTAHPDCQPLLKKILMLTRSAKIPRGQQVRYAEGVAKQMAGVNASAGPVDKPLRMCSHPELWRIVAALAKYIERHAKQ